MRHLPELVGRPHADAIREVAALHGLGSLLDSIDRASDREDQHSREQSGDHVDEEQSEREAEDDVGQNAQILIGARTEVELKQVSDRIDDQREELMFAVGLPRFPIIQVREITPDDLAAEGVKNEILHVGIVVEIHVAVARPDGHGYAFAWRLALIAFPSDTDDHAGSFLELVGPGAIDRLHEDHGPRHPFRTRKLSRDDQQGLQLAPGHPAECRLLQPRRELRGARRRRVVDFECRQRIGRFLAGQPIFERG